MDISKKRGFVDAGKRLRMKKGGVVPSLPKRQRFVDGGTVHALSGPATLTTNNATNPNTGVLGTVGQLLGLNNNFQAGAANITPGTNVDQLNQIYQDAIDSLHRSTDFTNMVNPGAKAGTDAQQQLLNQELAMSRGEGPNPALAQLRMQTGNNMANQAAQQAGQRGANQNVGLIARNIANQGANIQQQEIGQEAGLEANQQIAAQGRAEGLAGTQVNQGQTALLNENTAAQNEQQTLQNANTAANNAAVGMQSNINNTNSQTAAANQNMAGKVLGSLTSAASSLFAEGGEVDGEHLKLAEMNAASLKHAKKYAAGGPVYNRQSEPGGPTIEATHDLPAAGKSLGSLLDDDTFKKKKKDTDGGATTPDDTTETSLNFSPSPEFAKGGGVQNGKYRSHIANFLFAEGGEVPAMVSPGEIYLSPEQVRKVVHEGHDPAKVGQKIGGKAKVKGDSYSNDTVPMTLQEGGVVIDRKNVGTREKRELFVHRAIARKKAERK